VTTATTTPITTAELKTETVTTQATLASTIPALAVTTVPPATTASIATLPPVEIATTTPTITTASVTVPAVTLPPVASATLPAVASATLPAVASATLPATATPLPLGPGPVVLPDTQVQEILPQPELPAIKVGLKVAEEEKEGHASVHKEAVAAAAATGSYAIAHDLTESDAEKMATEVATYIFHKDGNQSVAQAKISGAKAVQTALSKEDGKFVTRGRLRHQFKDCWEACGQKPGYCDHFCGQGNACCRKSGDKIVPNECEQVYTFYTPHYECVVPTVVYTPGVALPATKSKEEGADDSAMIITGEEGDGDGQAQGKTDNSLGVGKWILVLLTILAICLAGIAGYNLSRESKAATLKVGRATEVDEPDSSPAGDLELQAPLVAGVPPVAPVPVPVAVPHASAMVAPPMAMPVQYHYTAASSQGLFAAGAPVVSQTAAARVPGLDIFDRIDRNHDGVLQREELERALQAGSVAVGGASAAVSMPRS